ncbi:hypothetical protein KY311_02090 [Candidatus Woesearchaeota archaeon]|nr:hypothetical protein [Candidatus Woesearchaeota archaeon]
MGDLEAIIAGMPERRAKTARAISDAYYAYVKQNNAQPTINQLSKSAGITHAFAKRLVEKLGLDVRKLFSGKGMPKKRLDDYAEEIIELISKGVGSQKEIMEITGVSEYFLRKIALDYGFNLPVGSGRPRFRKSGTKRIAAIDDVLDGFDGSLTLRDMGKLTNRTREAVRLYMIKTGQYELFMAKRKEYKTRCPKGETARKAALCDVAARIWLQMYRKAAEDGNFAYQKAIEYKYVQRKRNIDFDKLLKLFEAYEELTKNNAPIYLMDLDRASGVKYNHARFVLDAMNLPYTLKQPRYNVSAKEEKLIVRFLKNTSLSEADIAHFVKRKYNVVRDVKRRHGISGRKPKYVKMFGRGKERMMLAYSEASGIIECLDAGLDFHETVEYTGSHPALCVYVSRVRDEVEEIILRQLRKVHRKLNTPYIP